MPHRHLGEEISKVSGDLKVAPLEELLARDAGPPPMDLAATDWSTKHQHCGGVAVVRPAIAILLHRAAEL